MIKLLHTADQQLGVKFAGFGEKGRVLRRAVKGALKDTVDLALAENVDIMLVAGDLFDSNRVSRNLVEETVTQLRRLDPVPVCILPGTHDCFDATSVYKRPEFQRAANIHIFTDELRSLSFPRLDLTLYGRANLSPKGTESPLAGLQKTGETTYHVAMAHGEIAIEGKFSGDYYPIEPKEISASGMNYIALGHWHRYADFSQGDVKAFYSGAPEPLTFEEGEDSGFVLLVSMDQAGTRIEKKRVGRFIWKSIAVTVETFEQEEELFEEIEKQADEDALLRVKLRGLKPLTWDVSEDHILEALGDRFFHLEVNSSDLSPSVEGIPAEEFPETTLMGQFVRLMEKRLEAAELDEKPVLEEAFRRGFALLSGKEA